MIEATFLFFGKERYRNISCSGSFLLSSSATPYKCTLIFFPHHFCWPWSLPDPIMNEVKKLNQQGAHPAKKTEAFSSFSSLNFLILGADECSCCCKAGIGKMQLDKRGENKIASLPDGEVLGKQSLIAKLHC